MSTLLSVSATPGLTPSEISKYQLEFKHMLRFTVPKMDGTYSLVPMKYDFGFPHAAFKAHLLFSLVPSHMDWYNRPGNWNSYAVTNWSKYREYNQHDHDWFVEFYKSAGIYTLAYTPEAYTSWQYLEQHYPEVIPELAAELNPARDNQFLARRHGSLSLYNTGCRGPLCRNENTLHSAERRAGHSERVFNPSDKVTALWALAESYKLYLEYLRELQQYRTEYLDGSSSQRKLNWRWRNVNLRETLLIDVTPEDQRLIRYLRAHGALPD